MDYDNLEQHIYENDIKTYDILNALTPFYRYKLYQKIKENSRLSDDCDAREWAENIIRMLPRLKKSVVDTFELVSFSHEEIRHIHGITGQKLSSKANRARITIRKALGISRDDDEVQKQFDADKASRYKTLKYNGYSVQDSINQKKKNNKARDWAISECVEASARLAGLTPSPCDSGYFISLTLPGKYHAIAFEQANDEINHRLNSIKKYAERADILWLGIYKIHGHQDETPHLHIIYYVADTDKEKLEKILFKFFKNEEARWEENYSINQRITDFDGCLGYLFKDHGEPNVRTGFIGLRRDIRKVWNSLYTGDYGDSSLSYLSDGRMWIAKKLMKVRQETEYVQEDKIILVSPAYTLFALHGFKDDRLNNLGRKDNHPAHTDIRKMKEYINPVKTLYRYKNTRKTLSLSAVNSDCGKSYLYINTKNVLRIFFDYLAIKARGQPPPFLEVVETQKHSNANYILNLCRIGETDKDI